MLLLSNSLSSACKEGKWGLYQNCQTPLPSTPVQHLFCQAGCTTVLCSYCCSWHPLLQAGSTMLRMRPCSFILMGV